MIASRLCVLFAIYSKQRAPSGQGPAFEALKRTPTRSESASYGSLGRRAARLRIGGFAKARRLREFVLDGKRRHQRIEARALGQERLALFALERAAGRTFHSGRIDLRIVDANFVMQVRPGDQPCRPAIGSDLAPTHAHSCSHGKARQMAVSGRIAVAVRDDDEIAVLAAGAP